MIRLRFYLSAPFVILGTVFYEIGAAIAGDDTCSLMDKWDDKP